MPVLCLRKWAASCCKQTYSCGPGGRPTPNTTWLPQQETDSWKDPVSSKYWQHVCPDAAQYISLSQRTLSWCWTITPSPETPGYLRAPLHCHLVTAYLWEADQCFSTPMPTLTFIQSIPDVRLNSKTTTTTKWILNSSTNGSSRILTLPSVKWNHQ